MQPFVAGKMVGHSRRAPIRPFSTGGDASRGIDPREAHSNENDANVSANGGCCSAPMLLDGTAENHITPARRNNPGQHAQNRCW